MDEHIEITTVDGQNVKVSLYGTLSIIGKAVRKQGTSSVGVPVGDGYDAVLSIRSNAIAATEVTDASSGKAFAPMDDDCA